MAEFEPRVIAVDWSGEKSGGAKKIWLAEASSDQILRLENGRTRVQLIEHFINLGSTDPRIVVGIDFAFSMPEWFVREQGVSSGPDFWNVVAQNGERWLETCPLPFWGRKDKRKPTDVELLRRTEHAVGSSPSSVFLIAGGKQVGTGSIRGMPFLSELRKRGWSVWPFDPPNLPLVIEIYPRLFMGSVVKSSPLARFAYLEQHFPRLDSGTVRLASSTEDAFDAAVSALVMAQHTADLRNLPWPVDSIDLLEGRIWGTTR